MNTNSISPTQFSKFVKIPARLPDSILFVALLRMFFSFFSRPQPFALLRGWEMWKWKENHLIFPVCLTKHFCLSASSPRAIRRLSLRTVHPRRVDTCMEVAVEGKEKLNIENVCAHQLCYRFGNSERNSSCRRKQNGEKRNWCEKKKSWRAELAPMLLLRCMVVRILNMFRWRYFGSKKEFDDSTV